MDKGISDETIGEEAVDRFLSGYDPLLYAAGLGLTPEQVWDQIRATLRIYVDKATAAEQKLSRKGTGRKSLFGRPMTNAERQRRKIAKQKASK
jgi:hypothetical protein